MKKEIKQNVKIVVDPGSSHGENMETARDIVYAAKLENIDSVKFQLFDDKPPNIKLPIKIFEKMVEIGERIGVEVFASVFDRSKLQILKNCGCQSIKFAYSMRDSEIIHEAVENFKNVYVSVCHLELKMIELKERYGERVKYLYCPATYPAYTTFHGLSEKMFPDRFYGYSDHTLGIKSAIFAVIAGAKLIERHVKVSNKIYNSKAPDDFFASTLGEIGQLVRYIKANSIGGNNEN